MSTADNQPLNPNDFIITRKRKLYKFAAFRNLANCYDDQHWQADQPLQDVSRPLVIEIGAGTALFLTKLAQDQPAKQFVAIDRKSDRLYKGAKLATELNLTNIVYLWSNARNLISLLGANSVQELWITFPDPWPQESNTKHRLTNPKFLAEYYRLLAQDGTLNFKTDNRPLFDWSVEQFDSNHWQITQLTHDLHHTDGISSAAKIMTTYEERYVADGKPINYLQAIKRPDKN